MIRSYNLNFYHFFGRNVETPVGICIWSHTETDKNIYLKWTPNKNTENKIL